jgi:hypothetical protein
MSESWETEAICNRTRLGPGPLPQPPVPTPTHIERLTKGIMAAKDRVGDRDQGWASPLLPRREVIIGIIFCLEEEE